MIQAESNGKVAEDNERDNEQCLLLLHQRRAVCLGRTWDPSPCVCVRPMSCHTQCDHFYSSLCCTLFNQNPIFREVPVCTRHMREHKHPHNGFIRNKPDKQFQTAATFYVRAFTNTHCGADGSAPNTLIMFALSQ